jgi:hypothetical protein
MLSLRGRRAFNPVTLQKAVGAYGYDILLRLILNCRVLRVRAVALLIRKSDGDTTFIFEISERWAQASPAACKRLGDIRCTENTKLFLQATPH